MTSNLKLLFYPLLCFFSLILSLVVLAQVFLSLNSWEQNLDFSCLSQILFKLIYVFLIAAASYFLTISHQKTALSAASLIILFSIGFVTFKQAPLNLMIYYIFYAVMIASFNLNYLLSKNHQK